MIHGEYHENPSYWQIACDYGLWCDFFDTGGIVNENKFDELSIESKIAMIEEVHGKEEDQPN